MTLSEEPRHVQAHAAGSPGEEIADAATREGCDLIAMTTHGHRFLQDLLYGSVANEVRHISRVPVLLVRGERRPSPPRQSLAIDHDSSGRSTSTGGAP